MKQIGDPKRNYAREWKAFRRRYGLTQEKLAQALQITRRAVIKTEKGETRPYPFVRERMRALAKAYEEA